MQITHPPGGKIIGHTVGTADADKGCNLL